MRLTLGYPTARWQELLLDSFGDAFFARCYTCLELPIRPGNDQIASQKALEKVTQPHTCECTLPMCLSRR